MWLTDCLSPRVQNPPSRLPGRQGLPSTNVAELVKRYPEGKIDNAEVISTPHVEQSAPLETPSNKGLENAGKAISLSEFEQSYAANLAPKYLTHAARPTQPLVFLAWSRLPLLNLQRRPVMHPLKNGHVPLGHLQKAFRQKNLVKERRHYQEWHLVKSRF